MTSYAEVAPAELVSSDMEVQRDDHSGLEAYKFGAVPSHYFQTPPPPLQASPDKVRRAGWVLPATIAALVTAIVVGGAVGGGLGASLSSCKISLRYVRRYLQMGVALRRPFAL
jgi:hypothetical protein